MPHPITVALEPLGVAVVCADATANNSAASAHDGSGSGASIEAPPPSSVQCIVQRIAGQQTLHSDVLPHVELTDLLVESGRNNETKRRNTGMLCFVASENHGRHCGGEISLAVSPWWTCTDERLTGERYVKHCLSITQSHGAAAGDATPQDATKSGNVSDAIEGTKVIEAPPPSCVNASWLRCHPDDVMDLSIEGLFSSDSQVYTHRIRYTYTEDTCSQLIMVDALVALCGRKQNQRQHNPAERGVVKTFVVACTACDQVTRAGFETFPTSGCGREDCAACRFVARAASVARLVRALDTNPDL